MSDIGFVDISTHNSESLSVSDTLKPWSGVRVVWDGDEWDAADTELLGEQSRLVKKGDKIGFAGDESGRVLTVKVAFGQSLNADPSHMWDRGAAVLLDSIRDDAYSAFDAQEAVIDPAFEIGDAVSLPDGALSMIYGMAGELDGLCAVDVSAPPDEAINTAYPASWL